jgi:hypothetical protein
MDSEVLPLGNTPHVLLTPASSPRLMDSGVSPTMMVLAKNVRAFFADPERARDEQPEKWDATDNPNRNDDESSSNSNSGS